jgi:CheY-like chemotaxis protein
MEPGETESRSAEAAAVLQQRVAELLRYLDVDLRTSLDGLLNVLELIGETPLTGPQQDYLALAKEAGGSLCKVVTGLLDLSRLRAGAFHLDPIPFSLRDSLGYTMGTLALRAQETDAKLVCHILNDVPDLLVGDPTALRYMVISLVDQAITRATHRVVTLRVEADWPAADHVELHCALIETNPDPTAQPIEGRDDVRFLVTSRLIGLMGGRLWVEQGGEAQRTVHFTASFGVQAGSIERPLPANPERLGGLAALVVTDHDLTKRLLYALLMHWSLDPVVVDGVEAAWAVMEERVKQRGSPFSLVLLSPSCASEESFGLAQRIKDTPAYSQTRLMMVTAVGQRGDAARCRQCRITAYLTRPVTSAELFDTIMTVLGAPLEIQPPLLVTRHSLRERHQLTKGAPTPWSDPSTSS